ncbi:hypothetical protein E2C01_051853 [Portunus trituberculatus]|uniref:Uncharacterized protein n=1 Tax=Portunus trituberculatus TaxID=210409 RepID=A0A5B7GMU5_PORTR|nr:hypothetical protein [Portunus trituberculatus]
MSRINSPNFKGALMLPLWQQSPGGGGGGGGDSGSEGVGGGGSGGGGGGGSRGGGGGDTAQFCSKVSKCAEILGGKLQ